MARLLRNLWLVSVGAASACGAPPRAPVAPAHPAAVRAAPSPAASPVAPPPAVCLDPMADGRARLGGAPTVVLEPIADPPDLDGDGHPDVVLRSPGGRESTHLLYLASPGACARFLGRIEAFMLGCDGRGARVPCDLWVDTWLMHGDRLRTRWSFDGTSYKPHGDGELVPGPRRRP